MKQTTAGARGLLLLGLALLWALGLASGCASVSKEMEKGYHALAQEAYYLKRQTKLYARPDRTSAERGYANRGDKAVKLEGDVRGWSKVKVGSNGVEGWLPASDLSSKPVSPASAKPQAAQKAPAASESAKTPAADQPAPAKTKSDSFLSPPSAEAAEAPPPAKAAPPKRKADPKKFEAL